MNKVLINLENTIFHNKNGIIVYSIGDDVLLDLSINGSKFLYECKEILHTEYSPNTRKWFKRKNIKELI